MNTADINALRTEANAQAERGLWGYPALKHLIDFYVERHGPVPTGDGTADLLMKLVDEATDRADVDKTKPQPEPELRGGNEVGYPGFVLPDVVAEGSRHETLVKYVGHLMAKAPGMTVDQMLVEVKTEFIPRCKPPFHIVNGHSTSRNWKRVAREAWDGGVKKGYLYDPDRAATLDLTPEAPAIDLRIVGRSPKPIDADGWLGVDNLFRPRSINVLASVEGAGKSTIRRELAIMASLGQGLFLGHYPIVASTGTLLIDEDNGEDEEWRGEEAILDGLDRTHADLADNYRAIHFRGADLSTPGGMAITEAAIRTFAEAYPDEAFLTVLDTGGAMTAEEWGKEFKSAWSFLRALTVAYDTAILVCVHLVKPGRGRDRTHGTVARVITDVMGQWTRHANVVILMSALNEDGTKARIVVRKRAPRASFIVAQEAGRWVKVADDVERIREDPILELIASGVTTQEPLIKVSGLSKRTVDRSIASLRKGGFLTSDYPYRLSPAGEDASATPEDGTGLALE